MRLLIHVLFWISLMTTLWGAFEMAYDLWRLGAIDSPVWSGIWGPPILHHYLLGVIGAGVAWVLLSRKEILALVARIRREAAWSSSGR